MERSAAEEGKIQGLFTLEREREREIGTNKRATYFRSREPVGWTLGGEKSRACFHVLGDWTQRGIGVGEGEAGAQRYRVDFQKENGAKQRCPCSK